MRIEFARANMATAMRSKFGELVSELEEVEGGLMEEFGTDTSPGDILARLAALEAKMGELEARHASVVARKSSVLSLVSRELAGPAKELNPDSEAVTEFEVVYSEWNASHRDQMAACAELGGATDIPLSVRQELDALAAASAAMAEEGAGNEGGGRGRERGREDVPRNQARWFVPVTEEEFGEISDLVRGRLRVDDVNVVYAKVYNVFQDNPSRSPLTPQALTKMGLKVTGTSGKAKLNVLRILGLITMSSSGVSLNKSVHRKRRS